MTCLHFFLDMFCPVLWPHILNRSHPLPWLCLLWCFHLVSWLCLLRLMDKLFYCFSLCKAVYRWGTSQAEIWYSNLSTESSVSKSKQTTLFASVLAWGQELMLGERVCRPVKLIQLSKLFLYGPCFEHKSTVIFTVFCSWHKMTS